MLRFSLLGLGSRGIHRYTALHDFKQPLAGILTVVEHQVEAIRTAVVGVRDDRGVVLARVAHQQVQLMAEYRGALALKL